MSDTRRLFFIYLTALAVLLSSVVVTIVVTEMTAARLEEDAKTINDSGRQRMLSQRIVYLAQDLHIQSVSGGAGSAGATAFELERAIDRFRTSHRELSTHPDYGELFFASGRSEMLDSRVRRFVDLARSVAGDPTRRDALRQLQDLERAGMLADLDTVVSAIEASSVSRVSLLRTVGRFSIGVALVIILVEIAFVFLPGHQLIEQTIRDLAERNSALDAAQDRLAVQNAELAISNAALQDERKRVEEALRESEALRGEQVAFTYAVSHDLKSPANTLQLLLDELSEHCEDCFDDFARELVDHGRKTLTRMSEQVEDVLSYALASERRTDPEQFELTGLAAEVCRSLKADIVTGDARVVFDRLDPIWGYRNQVFSLLQNLLMNALKYQPPGARADIRVSSEPLADGGGVRIEVADNGIGIAPENHEKIFGVFERLHLQSEFPGSGLGLSTCARIARNHGGEIAVRSVLGQGSVFAVTLRDPRGSQTSLRQAA